MGTWHLRVSITAVLVPAPNRDDSLFSSDHTHSLVPFLRGLTAIVSFHQTAYETESNLSTTSAFVLEARCDRGYHGTQLMSDVLEKAGWRRRVKPPTQVTGSYTWTREPGLPGYRQVSLIRRAIIGFRRLISAKSDTARLQMSGGAPRLAIINQGCHRWVHQ